MDKDPIQSSSPEPAATATAPEAPTSSPETAASTKPLSFRQRLADAAAALAGSGDAAKHAAEVEQLQNQVAALTSERDAAKQRIATLESDLSAAQASLKDAEAAVGEFESRVRKVAIEQVASAGIAPEKLPAAASSGDDPAVALREELKTCTDSVRKGQICAQLAALRQWN